MRPAFPRIRTYLRLCKIKISFLSSLSALTGFAISASLLTSRLIPAVAGVFLLACGASALNQYQERDIDALMPRTQNRPIPSGSIRPLRALVFSLLCISAGMAVLFLAGSVIPPFLGLLAILWYNGLYTFLKRKTAFAVIPGAFTGAMPVSIGWVSAGGGISDPGLIMTCFFFFMWQVPHFWLLVATYGNEYEKAGIPSPTGIFAKEQFMKIIFTWIIAVSVSCLLLPYARVINASVTHFCLLFACIWLAWCGLDLLRKKEGCSLSVLEKCNLFMFLVLVLISIDRLLI